MSNSENRSVASEAAPDDLIPESGSDSTRTMVDAALGHYERGEVPIRVQAGTKAPRTNGWQKTTYADAGAVRATFAGHAGNLGVLLGQPSNGTVNVDLDCPEAILLAPTFLPATDRKSGHGATPDSARWYLVADPGRTIQFEDPIRAAAADVETKRRAMLVELRGTGGQTLVAPSIHPDGDAYEWHGETPAEASWSDLRDRTAELAAAALLARYWPSGPANRNKLAMGLGGGLLRLWDGDVTRVESFVEAVCRTAGDEETLDRVGTVRSTAEKIASGQEATGWPSLAKLLPLHGDVIVGKVCEWLGVDRLGDDARDRWKQRTGPQTDPRIMSAYDLVLMELPEPRWVIPGILPEGLTILAGKPKRGKSWLVLQWAFDAAIGGQRFGEGDIPDGDVLYLALEDNKRRLQSRLRSFVSSRKTPANHRLSWSVEWPRADEGGLDTIEKWIEAHPDARMIVVDTLEKFRPRRKAKADIYAEDYEALSGLKRLADTYNIAVVVVLHRRKSDAGDIIDTVLGTTGITGAADTILVLVRESSKDDGVLHITGRDVDEQELALVWSKETLLWSALGSAAFHRFSKERQELIDLLKKAPGLKPRDVADRLGISQPAARKRLYDAKEHDHVYSDNDGGYFVVGPESPVTPVTR